MTLPAALRTQNPELELFSSTSVLIIDHEDRIRHVCINLFSGEGFDVDQAENAEKGLSLLAGRHFDIILLDLLMPGTSAWRPSNISAPIIRIRW